MWLKIFKENLFNKHRFFVLFSLFYIIFSFLTYKNYGITSDEQLEYQAGKAYLKFLFLSPSNREELADNLAVTHNPLKSPYFRLYSGVVSFLNFKSYYEWAHLFNLLFGYMGFLAVYLVVFNATQSMWAVLGPILLFMNPHYFGHIPANPKDIPFATIYILCLSLLIVIDPRSNKSIFILGPLLGITVGMRFVGITLFLIYGFRVVATIKNASDFPKMVMHGLFVGLIGMVILYLLWPYLWYDPIGKFVESARKAQDFSYWDREILFNGRLITKETRPWNYLQIYIFYKTPLLILVGTIASLSLLKTNKYVNIIALTLGLNIALYLFLQPTIYNEMRHFLYLVPLMTSMSAIYFVKGFESNNKVLRMLIVGGFLVGIIKMSYDFVALHPYQYVYYNEISGKMSNIAKKYELDYWSASYKESAEYLRRLALEKQDNIKVYPCNLAFGVDYYSHKVFALVNESKKADYIICDYQNALINNFDLESNIVFRVVRKGATLSYVAKTNR